MVATGIAGQLLATQCGCTAGNNTPPRLGLRGRQSMGCQIRHAKLAQRIGQAGQGLQLGQARQQIQRGDIFGRAKLWADQVQIFAARADVAVTQ